MPDVPDYQFQLAARYEAEREAANLALPIPLKAHRRLRNLVRFRRRQRGKTPGQGSAQQE